jgi:hypothetical protein
MWRLCPPSIADGRPVAVWRARKQGRRLAITVQAFARLPRKGIQDAAERLAPHRGCKTATVEPA